MKTEVHIISLASAQERRAYQQAQAQRLGFMPIWQRAWGVDELSDPVFLDHAFSWQRPLKKTEVGCFLSHLQVWQHIAAGTSPAVVLEDDVILADTWPQALDELAQAHGVDCINLETVGRKQLGPAQAVGPWTLRRLHLNGSGAGAYLLWPQGAQKLLRHYQREGAALADAFMSEARDFRVWQLDPALVIQMCMLPYYGLPAQEEGISQIARERHASPQPPTAALRWRMKWRRLRGEWRKGLKRLGVLWGQRRQYVPYLNHQRRG